MIKTSCTWKKCFKIQSSLWEIVDHVHFLPVSVGLYLLIYLGGLLSNLSKQLFKLVEMWSDSFCEGLGPTIGSSSISLSCSMLLVLCLWWLIITFNDWSWSIFVPDVSKLLVLVVDWCMKKRGFLWDSADKKHSRSWHDSSSSASLLLSLNVKRLMSKNSNDESETPSSLLHHWLSLLAVSSKSLLVVACRYLNLLADLLVLKTFVSKIVLLFCLWMKLLATMNNLWKQITNSITLC